jgi:hypothetical protein
VGLERGQLDLVSAIEELLGRKKSRIRPLGSVTLTTWHPYPQKLALTSPTSGGRSVGIVGSRTQAMEFSFFSMLEKNSSMAHSRFELKIVA